MLKYYLRGLVLALAMIFIGLAAKSAPVQAQTIIDFTAGALAGENLTNPTSLQFGPDGRLYVSQQNGTVYAYTIERAAANDYQITNTEVINLVKNFIPNHDDDGTPNPENKRQVTGIYVTGTGFQPILYVTSSDSRIGAGGEKGDVGLDTNSGVVSRLTCIGGMSNDVCTQWEKVDLIRGLPRSEENHSVNGLALDPAKNELYVTVGGSTNAGAPSNNFASTTEYAYDAAILSVDLTAIDALPVQEDTTLYPGYTYKWVLDLPTLDDPTRPNANGIDNPSLPGYDGIDINDPFGGNDGLNQAKVLVDSPVQIHSPGWRNVYDVILTYPNGPGTEPRMYAIDNGANPDWGGHPIGEADYPRETTVGLCTNAFPIGEPGSTENNPGPGGDLWVNNKNGLHYVRELQPGEFNYAAPGEAYYAGHPTPLRGNPMGAGLWTAGDHTVDPDSGDNTYWRNAVVLDGNGVPIPEYSLPYDWDEVFPASLADPAECDFRNSGEMDGALANYDPSTNGLAEYTASNLGGKFQGDILSAGFNGNIFRAILSPDGKTVTNCDDPSQIYQDNLTYLQNGGDPSKPWDGTSGIKKVKSCKETFASGFGSVPLDVIAQGDNDIFPGTVWAVTYGSEGSQLGGGVTIFEPTDYDGGSGQVCDDTVSDAIDGDNDGYTNQDELDNGTNVCSGAEIPPDNDKTFEFGDNNQFLRSDLNDPDDDNDTLTDEIDRFPLDCGNGFPSMSCEPSLVNTASLPVEYNLLNNDPGFGIGGLGFTGLMTDTVTDYYNLQTDPDQDELIFGGTSGLFTIPSVGPGDTTGATNTAVDNFQFGLNVDQNSDPFTVVTTVNTPVFNNNPQGDQSFGMYIGTGDMDNFVKVVVHANNGAGGIQVVYEENGTPVSSTMYTTPTVDVLSAGSNIRLYLYVNPQNGQVIPGFELDGDLTGEQMPTPLGSAIQLTGNTLAAVQGNFTVNALPSAMAVGTIGTSGSSGVNYSATWDSIYIEEVLSPATATVLIDSSNLNTGSTFQDDSFTITNTSNTANITSVTIDLRDTLLPDVVFDPDGTAGDDASKGFSPLTGTDTTTGVTGHTFGDPHNGVDSADGFYTLTINFNDFAPGEVLQFGVDADPLSTKGTAAPGPNDAASVNGMELSGARAIVAFDNGDTHDVQLFSVVDSKPGLDANADSENIVRNQIPGTPTVNMLSVTAPALVTTAQQTVRVSGPVQSDVKLIHVEAGLYTENGGYEIDPLEVNKAVAFTEYIGQTSNDGTVDFDVVLTQTDAASGYNLFAAVIIDDDGATSDLSDVIVVQFDADGANAEPPPAGPTLLRINAGGPEYTDPDNNLWLADQNFTGGQCSPNCAPDGDSPTILKTDYDPLYQTERYDKSFDYTIPVTNGTYTLDLYFAEIFFGVGSNTGGDNSRVFDVTIEGNLVLDNYDIHADVGPATAVVKRFENIEVTDGVININFNSNTAVGGKNNAKVSAIHVFEPENGGGDIPITVGDNMDSNLYSIAQDVVIRQFVAVGGDNTLEFNATGLPNGLAINTSTGLISGTITDNAATGGTNSDGIHNVTVTVDDNDGDNTDVQTVNFTWTVYEHLSPSLLRINAGGGQFTDANGNIWGADQYAVGGSCNPVSCQPSGGSPAIAVTTDDVLYQTERFAETFSYEIPVTNGSYTLDLHFAEIFFGVGGNGGGVGSRIFDVSIEGNLVLDNYDIDADSAPATPTIRRFTNVSVTDGFLTISFNSTVGVGGENNAKIAAIHVYEPSDIPINLASIPNQFNLEGEQSTLTVAASGGNGNLAYSQTGLPNGLSIEPTNGQIFGIIDAGAQNGGPNNNGVYNVTITVDDSDADDTDVVSTNFTWVVDNPVDEAAVLYRVNVGGAEVAAADASTPNWGADTEANPSSYLTGFTPTAGNGFNQTADTIGLANVSVAGGPAPQAVFQTERDGAMQWEFPVDAGISVELRLYFAEIVLTDNSNPRIFDVSIEGSVPAAFNDIDQFGTRMHDAAFMRFVSGTLPDDTLNLEVIPVSNGATLKGIEIVTTEPVPTITAPTEAQVLSNANLNITLAAGTPNSGAQQYIVQVATDNTFTNVIYNSGVINTTSTQTTLPGAGTYYVRARQTEGTDTSPWSAVTSFSLAAGGDNVLQNADFSQGTTAYTFTNATPNVAGEVLQVTRTNINSYGIVSQVANGVLIPANSNVEVSAKLGNTGVSAKRVGLMALARNNGGTVLGSVVCEFTVPATPTLTEYALTVKTPIDLINVEFRLMFEDFSDGLLLVDDTYLGAPADLNGAVLTGLDCIKPETPANSNLVVNSLFNGQVANFGFEGGVTRSVNSGILNVTRSDANASAAVTQQINLGVVANAPLQTSVQVGNSSHRTKNFTLRLENGANAAEAMQCQFTVPANMPLKTYTMLGAAGATPWNTMKVKLLLEDYNVASLTADNVRVVYNAGASVAGTVCTTAVPNAGTPVNVNGDFQVANALYNFDGGLTYNWQNGVINVTGAQGGVAQAISQTLRYKGVPTNIPLQLAVELGNSGTTNKPVILRIWDGTNAANAITCNAIVYANTAMQMYTLQGLTNTQWSNVQVQVLVDNFASNGSVSVDNLALTYEPTAGITGTTCDMPPAPDVNLLDNGDFENGDAVFDFTGAIDYSDMGGQIAITRTDPEQEASISQTATASIPANGRVLAGVHLSNPTAASKTVRLTLAETSSSSNDLVCFFEVGAGTSMRQYALGGFTDSAWSSVYFELTVLDDGTPSLYVDNAEVRYAPNATFATEFCYEGEIVTATEVTSAAVDEVSAQAETPIIDSVAEPESAAPIIESAAPETPLIETAE